MVTEGTAFGLSQPSGQARWVEAYSSHLATTLAPCIHRPEGHDLRESAMEPITLTLMAIILMIVRARS